MAAFNKVILMGNLTRDPEIRYTASGTAVCGLSLAVNRSYRTQSGELREDPCFIDVTAWSKQAESCHNYLRKGAPVFIEGSLRYETWTDKISGQSRSKHTVSAETVRFLGSPQQSNGGSQGSYRQSVSQPPRPESQAHQPQAQPQQSTMAQAPSSAVPSQAAPTYKQPNQVNESSGFQPPPMPDFEVESEDDIPF